MQGNWKTKRGRGQQARHESSRICLMAMLRWVVRKGGGDGGAKNNARAKLSVRHQLLKNKYIYLIILVAMQFIVQFFSNCYCAHNLSLAKHLWLRVVKKHGKIR